MAIVVLDGGNDMVKVVMHGRVIVMSRARYAKWSAMMGGKNHENV